MQNHYCHCERPKGAKQSYKPEGGGLPSDRQSQNRDCFVIPLRGTPHNDLRNIIKVSFFLFFVFLFFSPLLFSGPEERITLDLKGVEVGELFKILSLKSGRTIITTPEVKGRVSVFLNNLTFDDALDVILTMQDLACEKNDNLVKVMTSVEFEGLFGRKFNEKKKIKVIKLSYAKPSNISNAISSLKSEIGKIIVDEPSGTILLIDSPESVELIESAIKELDMPLETAVFEINYAKSADIKAYLNDLITPGVGQLIIDERSSKAIVSDLPQRLAKIRKLMEVLDETSRQVFISGEIIQVTLNEKYQRGIDWENILTNRKFNGLDFAGKFPLSPDLSAAYGKLNLGTLSRDSYTLVLKQLEDYGKVDVVSRPQIAAVNKEEASILIGSKEAYVTQTSSQSTSTTVTSESVEFIDVGVKLKVTPSIGSDGFITMRIKPELSSVRETLTTNSGSKIPIVETSQSETVVKVKDGAMLLIGGLIKRDNRDDISGLPKISKIPLARGLFSSRVKNDKRSELIIFLSPKLISGDLAKPNIEVKSNEKEKF